MSWRAKIRAIFGISSLLVACGHPVSDKAALPQESRVSFRSSASGSATQTGGIMIYGTSTDGNSYAQYLPNESVTASISLPNSTWSFYAIGWDGAHAMEGTPRCAVTAATALSGVDISVDIPLSSSACSNGFFSSSLYLSGSAPKPLALLTCASLTGVPTNASCNSSNRGDLRSYKVYLPDYLPGPPGAAPSINLSQASGCQILSTTSGNAERQTALKVPVGSGSGSPIYTIVRGFSSADCTGSSTDYVFSGGLAAGSQGANQSLLYSIATSSYTGIFMAHGSAAAAPSVDTISPTSGPWSGGTQVTISGNNFSSGATVQIGANACSNVTVNSSSSITCTVGNNTWRGATAVSVSNSDGQSATKSGAFTFFDDGFGNGIDSSNMGQSEVTLNSSISDVSSATFISGGRTISVWKNVSAIGGTGTSAGTVLTLNPTITAADFQTNDEIMWHVTAASSSTACESNATLAPSSFGSGRVQSVSLANSSITLYDKLTNHSDSANNTALGNANHLAGSGTFCVLQITRVPNLTNLKLDASSGALTFGMPGFSFSSGSGGILALRVSNNLTLTGGSNSITFDASGKGFPGGQGSSSAANMQAGSGRDGQGATPNSNSYGQAGGSATSSAGASGGGNGGNGGAGGNGSGGGGYINSCHVTNGCIAMGGSGGGGGGGGAGAANGGNGGGIILIYARNIVTSSYTGTLKLIANGAIGNTAGTGTSSGAGGGAGGSSVLQSKGGSSANITQIATGGVGGGGGSQGAGGGAGGYLAARRCLNFEFSSLNQYFTGGTGGSGPYAGTTGGSGLASDNTQIASGTEFCP